MMGSVSNRRPSRAQQANFWNNPRVRGTAAQIALLAVIGWFAWEIIDNTITNLQERRIASGYRFLGSTAGFDIIQTLIPYSEVSTYGRAFIVGLLNTLLVAALGIVTASVIGFLIGIMRLSNNWLLAKVAAAYVEIIRNTPLLLQLFVWYRAVLKSMPGPRESHALADAVFLNNRGLYVPYPMVNEKGLWVVAIAALGLILGLGYWRHARRIREETGREITKLPVLLGLCIGLPLAATVFLGGKVSFDYPALQGFNFVGGIVVIPEFVALYLGLSIYTAAFIAEIVRAGILAVSKGQTEAAKALGLHNGATLRLVVVPQAMRVIIPPLANQYLNLTKNSSLAVAIGYPDVVAMGGTILNQTGQAVEVILLWMAVYLTLSLLTSGFMNWFNARMAIMGR